MNQYKQIDVMLADCWQGCGYQGAHLAPTELIQEGLLKVLSSHRKAKVAGEAIFPDALDPLADHPRMRYLGSILQGCSKLYQQMLPSLKQGNRVLTLGGDHAISLATLAASSEVAPHLGVVWIDGHGDINTADTSPSGNVHGMILAASMGFGHQALTKFSSDRIKINKDNVFWVGSRDLDKGEVDLIESENLNVYDPKTLKSMGPTQLANSILAQGKALGITAWHLSFDLDALDAKEVVATGIRLEDGFTMDETQAFFTPFLQSGQVVSVDLVEYNPSLDDGSTIKLIFKWAKHLADHWL